MSIFIALKGWLVWLLFFIRRLLVIAGFFGLMSEAIPYDWAALLVRLAVGLAMLPWGIKKYFERGNAAKFPKVLFFSPEAGFYSAMAIEILVPICLVLGFATRLAVVPAIISFAVAAKVGKGSCFTSHALLYLLMLIAIFLIGPGQYSLDGYLRIRLS